MLLFANCLKVSSENDDQTGGLVLEKKPWETSNPELALIRFQTTVADW